MVETRKTLTPEEKWESLTLANNFIFYKVMRHHPDACRHLIEILLGIKIDRIEMSNEESVFIDYDSHGIRLDVFVKGSDRIFDIEIQCTDTKDLPERSRYYQGVMDVDTLKSGTEIQGHEDFSRDFHLHGGHFQKRASGLHVREHLHGRRADKTERQGIQAFLFCKKLC